MSNACPDTGPDPLVNSGSLFLTSHSQSPVLFFFFFPPEPRYSNSHLGSMRSRDAEPYGHIVSYISALHTDIPGPKLLK